MNVEERIHQAFARRIPPAMGGEVDLPGLLDRARADLDRRTKVGSAFLAASVVIALTAAAVAVPRLTNSNAEPVDFTGALRTVTAFRYRTTGTFHMNAEIGDLVAGQSEGQVDLGRNLMHIREVYEEAAPRISFFPPEEIIASSDHAYYLIPAGYEDDEIPSEAQWIRFDRDDAPFGPRRGTLLNPAIDPVGYLETIQSTASRIDHSGNEDVRGIRTKRYEIEIDVKRAARMTGDDFLKNYAEVHSTMPLTLWIGIQDGLPYRVITRQEIPDRFESPGPRAIALTTTMELFDYNNPIDIRVPQGKEVFVAPAGFELRTEPDGPPGSITSRDAD